MMRTITTTFPVYELAELNADAKEHAYHRYCESMLIEDDMNFVLSEMADTLEMLGFDGEILYSGFWSQGDGACIRGEWQLSPDMKVPQDIPALLPALNALAKVAKEIGKEFYVTLEHSGNYCHEHTISIEQYYREDDEWFDCPALDRALLNLMREIYQTLEHTYNILSSIEEFEQWAKECGIEFFSSGAVYIGGE
jgi:hypothetical protein